MNIHSALSQPSDWVVKYASRIQKGGHVLDLACGAGRHALYLTALGFTVEALDIDLTTLRSHELPQNISLREADVENAPWPYAENVFDAIVVTHYLHRPLFAKIIAALKPQGVLIYETFALGNEKFGKPSNPDFLLQPGELLEIVQGAMQVHAYEDGFVELPKPAMIQRICAIKN
jgi:SAM-dependent methyltransferase